MTIMMMAHGGLGFRVYKHLGKKKIAKVGEWGRYGGIKKI